MRPEKVQLPQTFFGVRGQPDCVPISSRTKMMSVILTPWAFEIKAIACTALERAALTTIAFEHHMTGGCTRGLRCVQRLIDWVAGAAKSPTRSQQRSKVLPNRGPVARTPEPHSMIVGEPNS